MNYPLHRRNQGTQASTIQPIIHIPLFTNAVDIIGGVQPTRVNQMTFHATNGGVFNGNNSEIWYGNLLNMPEWTISFECYPTSHAAYKAPFGTYELTPVEIAGIGIEFGVSQFIFLYVLATSGRQDILLPTQSTFPLNNWSTIVVAVKNNERITLWSNNVLVFDSPISEPLNVNQPFCIGNKYRVTGTNRNFSGNQRNYKIYNKYLTPTDIN